MAQDSDFDLVDFLPYLLNQAAEESGLAFQRYYKATYGMLRTEWRVLFHLGRHGSMTARDICTRARVHKTKVSRAVAALEAKRFVTRHVLETDRRAERLRLTPTGARAYADLHDKAQAFDARLMAAFDAEEQRVLRRCLVRIAGL